MRDQLLVRHFLNQLVETDLSSDLDRHQVLALAAAGLVTVPLFVSILSGWRYLTHPLQAPGWTEVTALTDQTGFCATSILVSAIVAALQWDALALDRRDAMILGILPIPRAVLVRAKMLSLVLFGSFFAVAVNAIPAVVHPPLMVANLPLNPALLVPLIGARALSTMMASAFGFAGILAVRESMYLAIGRRRFERVSGAVRSSLLLVLLVLVLWVPAGTPGRAEWILNPHAASMVPRPATWFAGVDAAVTGRLLERLPRPDLPAWQAAEEDEFRARYRQALPRLTMMAWWALVSLGVLLAATATMYLWNARQLQVLPEQQSTATFRGSGLADALAKLLAMRSATRTGIAFLFRVLSGSPIHRFYLIVSVALAITLMLAMAPASTGGTAPGFRTLYLAAQTLMITALVVGLRAALRTSADEPATWIFQVADTGQLAAFRQGVRRGVLAIVLGAIALVVPVHVAAWDMRVACIHALNGAAIGWLLVEVACGRIEQPLLFTMPPNDGLNTVGVVFLGGLVILVFALAHIESALLTRTPAAAAFAGVLFSCAFSIRYLNARNDRALASVVRLPEHSSIS